MQEEKQEIYKIHCFYMGKIKKNDNLIIKDLMSSYKSRDLGFMKILRGIAFYQVRKRHYRQIIVLTQMNEFSHFFSIITVFPICSMPA